MTLDSINPFSGEIFSRTAIYSDQQIETALSRTHAGAHHWKSSSFSARSQLLSAIAVKLESNKTKLAEIITREMGKRISESRAEIEKCIWVCQFYAEHGAEMLADIHIGSDASKSGVTHQPLGTVLAVMPWNFPFWQVFRCLSAVVMSGNTLVLKHASNVPLCAAAIGKIMDDAGAPQGLFENLPIGSASVARLIADDRIHAVSLTGSEAAGRSVAEQAGKHLKKCVLELGGSDPFVVLEDADLEFAAQVGCQSRFMNSGQSCIAAKRFIIVDSVADQFLSLFQKHVANLQIGDPLLEQTTLAPMARANLRDELQEQVDDAIQLGANATIGGTKGSAYADYPATILDNIQSGMRVYSEEVFGPAALIVRVKDEQSAISIANASRYGLGSSVWTKDIQRGETIAKQLETGCTFINGMVKSDPRLPFGGVKASGYGRELSHLGLLEFTNAKTLWIR